MGANLPLVASCERSVTGDDQKIHITLNWQGKIKVPLVAGMLEKHAEGENHSTIQPYRNQRLNQTGYSGQAQLECVMPFHQIASIDVE